MIRRERRGAVEVVRLDAPPLHLIGREMIAAITRGFADIASDPPSVVVFFCGGAGANVRELVDLTPATARSFISSLAGAIASVRALDCPVIAAIDGPSLGAHLEVAAACDLRICSPSSRFGMPEVRVGIPSVIDACWLMVLCGLGEASRLVYEGEMIDATDAMRIGLVNLVAEDVEADALRWAERIARSSALALRQQKRVLREWTDAWHAHCVRTSIDHFADTFTQPAATDAMRAFLEKR